MRPWRASSRASRGTRGRTSSDAEVPLRTIVDAGIPVALGADDPLLFGSRLLAQYETARDVHGFTDEELAELARGSVRMSRAPDLIRSKLLRDIDDWLGKDAERQ